MNFRLCAHSFVVAVSIVCYLIRTLWLRPPFRRKHSIMRTIHAYMINFSWFQSISVSHHAFHFCSRPIFHRTEMCCWREHDAFHWLKVPKGMNDILTFHCTCSLLSSMICCKLDPVHMAQPQQQHQQHWIVRSMCWATFYFCEIFQLGAWASHFFSLL